MFIEHKTFFILKLVCFIIGQVVRKYVMHYLKPYGRTFQMVTEIMPELAICQMFRMLYQFIYINIAVNKQDNNLVDQQLKFIFPCTDEHCSMTL